MPIAVGLYARAYPASERFGTLLIVAGFGWFVVTLAGSSDARLYSTGRVADWVVEVLLVYVVLAFPSGRLPARADRLLVWAIALVAAFLYLPTALLVEQYPLPAPSVTCVASCPENAFMLVATEPAWVEDFVRPLREVLTVGLFVGVTVRLTQRFRGATHLTQRTLAPVLGVASFRLAALALAISVRRIDPAAPLMDVAIWLIALAVPLMAGAFLLGTWRWQLFMATAMHRLTTRLQAHPEPEDLRAALADAFDDPELEIVYWLDEDGGRWTDAAGLSVAPPSAAAERCVTEVRDGGRRVAAIVHDAALRDDHAFVDTASAYAIMALDNHRLSAQTTSLLREVQDSRARIQSSADDERRRIEHDLHDGAQQRLVALRIKLELAAEGAGDGQRARRRSAAGARRRGRRGARRGPLARARHLPRAACRPRPRRGAARGRAARRAADDGARRRGPPLLAAGRERRVLLLPGGDAERREARAATPRPSSSSCPTTARCASRSATTAPGSTSGS